MSRTVVRLLIFLVLAAAGLVQAADPAEQRNGVVKIGSISPEGKLRTGTGFIVRLQADAAFIVTAYHVVEGDKNPQVEFFSAPAVPVRAEVAESDRQLDVALVVVRGRENLPQGVLALRLDPEERLTVGEDVTTIGFPPGLPWAVTKASVVSQIGMLLAISGGAIDQGNSGGPVLKDGAVVAMVIAAERNSGRVIPAQFLGYVLQGWRIDLSQSAAAPSFPPKAATPQATPPASPAPRPPVTPPPTTTPALSPGQTFNDCDDCPEMVVVPAGRFMMGSPDSEKGRQSNESPVQVAIPAAFAVSKFEITRGQFAKFARATKRVSEGCAVWDKGNYRLDSARGWLDPGFAQSDDHPVVCVSFEDATAYVGWLGKQAGKRYRLLSEAEWEYAARAGTTTSRFWGDSEQQACQYANVGDRSGKAKLSWRWPTFDCDDRYAETAPVGKYTANAFGLHDILGNVLEWAEDCWNSSYQGAQTDGSALVRGECGMRVIRGGSWVNEPNFVRSANRSADLTSMRIIVVGFRVARPLP